MGLADKFITGPLKGVVDELGSQGQALLKLFLAAADEEVDEIRADAKDQLQKAEDRAQAMLTQVLDRVEKMERTVLDYVDSRKLRFDVYSVPKDQGPTP